MECYQDFPDFQELVDVVFEQFESWRKPNKTVRKLCAIYSDVVYKKYFYDLFISLSESIRVYPWLKFPLRPLRLGGYFFPLPCHCHCYCPQSQASDSNPDRNISSLCGLCVLCGFSLIFTHQANDNPRPLAYIPAL